MKKLFALFILMSSFTIAKAADNVQYIVTECGTTHEIPANCTIREAIAWLQFWSEIDCGIPGDQF